MTRLMTRMAPALAAAALALVACTPNTPPPEEPATRTGPDPRAVIAEIGLIQTPNGIEESLAVNIGGIPQWLSIRGKDRNNPVLILLHGGPGSAEMAAGWAFQRGWEDYFTVIQWDQRGAGKTWAANDPDLVKPTMTKDRMVADVNEVIDFARDHLDKDKVILMGHSWGSVIGLETALARPDAVAAYVGVGQVINMKQNEAEGWHLAYEAAKADGNDEAIAALDALAPYPGDAPLTFERIGAERTWSIHYGGLAAYRQDADPWFRAMHLSPEYDEDVLSKYDSGGLASLDALLPDLMAADFSGVTESPVPVFQLLGRKDMTTPPSLAVEWLDRLNAPAKGSWWFEHSAHLPIMVEPGVTLMTLVSCIRPYATEPDLAAAQEKTRACNGGTPAP